MSYEPLPASTACLQVLAEDSRESVSTSVSKC